jgi:hypothetical protein
MEVYKMKRKIAIPLALMLLVGAFSVYAAEPIYGLYNGFQKVKLMINGEELRGLSTPAFIIEGKTVLPVRETADALSAYTRWNDSTATVELIRPNVHLMIATKIDKSGESYTIQAPFGRVKKGQKLTFDVFSQVDGVMPEDVQFKIAIYDPNGEEVYSSIQNTFKGSSSNQAFWYPERVENMTFKQAGTYKVKFLLKPEGTKDYLPISEKTIYSN